MADLRQQIFPDKIGRKAIFQGCDPCDEKSTISKVMLANIN
jgi:hypothetical protein